MASSYARTMHATVINLKYFARRRRNCRLLAIFKAKDLKSRGVTNQHAAAQWKVEDSYAKFPWRRRSYIMVSASSSLLSGAATVWRNLLLNILRQCIHVTARAATITCMVGDATVWSGGWLHAAADGVEWWISDHGPQLLGKATRDPLFHSVPLFLSLAAMDHGHNQGQGHGLQNDDSYVKLFKSSLLDQLDKIHVPKVCVLSRPTCLSPLSCHTCPLALSALTRPPCKTLCPCKDTC